VAAAEAGSGGSVASFDENCTCAGPPPTSWDAGSGRITELFIDNALKPAVGGESWEKEEEQEGSA
jgi:hypothetical protein